MQTTLWGWSLIVYSMFKRPIKNAAGRQYPEPSVVDRRAKIISELKPLSLLLRPLSYQPILDQIAPWSRRVHFLPLSRVWIHKSPTGAEFPPPSPSLSPEYPMASCGLLSPPAPATTATSPRHALPHPAMPHPRPVPTQSTLHHCPTHIKACGLHALTQFPFFFLSLQSQSAFLFKKIGFFPSNQDSNCATLKRISEIRKIKTLNSK